MENNFAVMVVVPHLEGGPRGFARMYVFSKTGPKSVGLKWDSYAESFSSVVPVKQIVKDFLEESKRREPEVFCGCYVLSDIPGCAGYVDSLCKDYPGLSVSDARLTQNDVSRNLELEEFLGMFFKGKLSKSAFLDTMEIYARRMATEYISKK